MFVRLTCKGARRCDEEGADGQRQAAEGWVPPAGGVDTQCARRSANGAAKDTAGEGGTGESVSIRVRTNDSMSREVCMSVSICPGLRTCNAAAPLPWSGSSCLRLALRTMLEQCSGGDRSSLMTERREIVNQANGSITAHSGKASHAAWIPGIARRQPFLLWPVQTSSLCHPAAPHVPSCIGR